MGEVARSWETSTLPERMMVVHPPGSGRKGRLFMVACCRAAWDSLPDGSRRAVEFAEGWADLPAPAVEDDAWERAMGAGQQEAFLTGQALRDAETRAEVIRSFPDLNAKGRRGALQHNEVRAEAQLERLRREANAAMAAHASMFRYWAADDFSRCARVAGWQAAADLLREVFGNPFRPAVLAPGWRTEAVVAVARGAYAERASGRLPVLADALEDAGCTDADILAHCRGPGPHVRGCWVVDLVLGKG
jgi:hypothetical protein